MASRVFFPVAVGGSREFVVGDAWQQRGILVQGARAELKPRQDGTPFKSTLRRDHVDSRRCATIDNHHGFARWPDDIGSNSVQEAIHTNSPRRIDRDSQRQDKGIVEYYRRGPASGWPAIEHLVTPTRIHTTQDDQSHPPRGVLGPLGQFLPGDLFVEFYRH